MGLIGLAVIGAVEAVVHLLRYRSAVGSSALWSAATTFALCCLRLVFIVAGVELVREGAGAAEVVLAMVAYAGAAAVVTLGVHWWLERERGEITITVDGHRIATCSRWPTWEEVEAWTEATRASGGRETAEKDQEGGTEHGLPPLCGGQTVAPEGEAHRSETGATKDTPSVSGGDAAATSPVGDGGGSEIGGAR